MPTPPPLSMPLGTKPGTCSQRTASCLTAQPFPSYLRVDGCPLLYRFLQKSCGSLMLWQYKSRQQGENRDASRNSCPKLQPFPATRRRRRHHHPHVIFSASSSSITLSRLSPLPAFLILDDGLVPWTRQSTFFLNNRRPLHPRPHTSSLLQTTVPRRTIL